MPPVSKKQARFMQGVKSGSISAPGLSQDTAAEFVDGYSTKGLPEAAPGRGSQRKRQSMRGKKSKGKPPMKGKY